MLVHLCTLLLVTSVLSLPVENKDLDAQFEEWKKTHSKVYSGPEEEVMRRQIWEKTLERVEAHNKEADQGLHTYRRGMNHFSDRTEEEWGKMHGILPPMIKNINHTMAGDNTLTPNKDLDAQFEEWKKTHSKVYSGPEEEVMRRQIWEKTLERVEAHNKEADQGLHTYRQGMNHFSDRTKEERQKMRGGIPPKRLGHSVPVIKNINHTMAENNTWSPNKDLDAQFEEWKKTHSKVYSGPEEEVMRRQIWEKTLEGVEAHNKEADQGLHTYRQGMNHFSDRTEEEWGMMHGILPLENLDLPVPVIKNTAGNDTWTPNEDLNAQFEEWKTKHKKVYSGPEEEVMRREIWEKTLEEVEAHNKEADQGLHTYRQGMNHFSDRTEDEMKKMHGILPPESR